MTMKGGFGDMMKQAQEMQEKMKDLQSQIENTEVIGESGAGMVRITMTGRHDVKRVDIDDSLMGEDKEVLEDLIAAAVNATVRKLEAQRQDKMAELTKGMPLPPGFKLPF